jgi:hypothetical protein
MRALKRLSHRNWGVLRDEWMAHLPTVDFDAQYPEPTLWQLPDIRLPELNAAGTAELPYVDGVREAIFREAVLLVRKFIYCGVLLPTLSGVGKNTWTAITAYEACFYGAKAFCYLLGFASLGRSSKIYLDAFCETERRVGKARIKVYETLRAHRLDDRLTHDVLWALTGRLVDTTTFDDDLREIQTELRIIDWEKFTSFRNSVLYDGSFWPLNTDMDACDLLKPIHNTQMKTAAILESTAEAAPFAGDYFVIGTLLRHLILGMLQSIAKFAPALSVRFETS